MPSPFVQADEALEQRKLQVFFSAYRTITSDPHAQAVFRQWDDQYAALEVAAKWEWICNRATKVQGQIPVDHSGPGGRGRRIACADQWDRIRESLGIISGGGRDEPWRMSYLLKQLEEMAALVRNALRRRLKYQEKQLEILGGVRDVVIAYTDLLNGIARAPRFVLGALDELARGYVLNTLPDDHDERASLYLALKLIAPHEAEFLEPGEVPGRIGCEPPTARDDSIPLLQVLWDRVKARLASQLPDSCAILAEDEADPEPPSEAEECILQLRDAATATGWDPEQFRGRVKRRSPGFEHLRDPANRGPGGRGYRRSALQRCPLGPNADPNFWAKIADNAERVNAERTRYREATGQRR